MSESEFDELLEEEFYWPKVGDELFPQGSSPLSAYIPKNPDVRGYHLTAGYRIAADILVDQTEEEVWLRDKLVFPILFCYRHFIELTLKDLLQSYGKLADIEPNAANHDLDQLWRNFRTLIDRMGDVDADDGSTPIVEGWVKEFKKIDPLSQAFRYPTGKKGAPFNAVQESIDLVNLQIIMVKMDTYFGCVGMWLQSLSDTP